MATTVAKGTMMASASHSTLTCERFDASIRCSDISVPHSLKLHQVSVLVLMLIQVPASHVLIVFEGLLPLKLPSW